MQHADVVASAAGGAAPTAPAEQQPAPLSMWSRRDDKLLEMLVWRSKPDPPWARVAAQLGDKTPEQALRRYVRLADELRLVLGAPAPAVETPAEWELQLESAVSSAPLTCITCGVALAVVEVTQTAPPGSDDLQQAAATAPAPAVETPPEWELQVAAVSSAPTRREAPAVVVEMTQTAPPRLDLQQAAAMAPAGGGQAAAQIEAARRAAAPALTSGMMRSKPRKPRSRRMSGGAPRKKAEMWSEHEHSQFLRGLEKCGKGKWKTMAREFVKTKSPIQIASHYQKFCIREESRRLNQCKRTSIHDITEPTTPAPETTPAAATAAGPSAPAALPDHKFVC